MKPEVCTALEQLEQDGRLNADAVVEAARPEDSALHSYIFASSDQEAAGKHRLKLAYQLIASYKVEIRTSKATGSAKTLLVRGYQSERRSGNAEAPAGTYVRTKDMTPNAQALLLQQMNRELRGLRQRYGHLQEFWAAIAELSEEHPVAETEPAAASG